MVAEFFSQGLSMALLCSSLLLSPTCPHVQVQGHLPCPGQLFSSLNGTRSLNSLLPCNIFTGWGDLDVDVLGGLLFCQSAEGKESEASLPAERFPNMKPTAGPS